MYPPYWNTPHRLVVILFLLSFLKIAGWLLHSVVFVCAAHLCESEVYIYSLFLVPPSIPLVHSIPLRRHRALLPVAQGAQLGGCHLKVCAASWRTLPSLSILSKAVPRQHFPKVIPWLHQPCGCSQVGPLL